jgi:hypothetical protein
MYEWFLSIAVPPIAYLLVFLASVLIIVFVVPLIVLVSGWLTGWAVRILLYPVRKYLASFSGTEAGTRIAQPLVAATFLCFFTSRVSDKHRIVAFLVSCTLILALAGVAYMIRARYRSHYSEILFDERFVYPIWDWISSQRRIVTMLGGIAPLRPLVWAVQQLGSQIHHRRWQLFFNTLFIFSLYTLPIQLFPALDRWLMAAVPSTLAESGPELITGSPWFAPPMHIAGIAYLYIFDWIVTIIGVYALVVLLSPLEPINNFNKVGRALNDFVQRRIFIFSGYFWQHLDDPAHVTIYPDDRKRSEPFEARARLIHKETRALDIAIRGAGQGCNFRVALVYEPEPSGRWSEPEVKDSYCFHYRRLGSSSYLVAADAEGKRFDGSNPENQRNFQQLGESIGYLVNVRDSLR